MIDFDKEQVDRRIENLERELEALKRARMDEHKAQEQWEPEGGDYTVCGFGKIAEAYSTEMHKLFGAERPTREQAERTAEKMRIHNRALAYVDEHAPDWDGSGPCCVVWANRFGKFICLTPDSTHEPPIGAVIGPAWVMQKLAKDLNSGRVKL